MVFFETVKENTTRSTIGSKGTQFVENVTGWEGKTIDCTNNLKNHK